MDLLQILSEFLGKNTGAGAWKPVFDLLKENSFDIRRTLSSLTPEKAAPIIKAFLSSRPEPGKNSGAAPAYGTAPISNIADKDIVYALNRYMGKI